MLQPTPWLLLRESASTRTCQRPQKIPRNLRLSDESFRSHYALYSADNMNQKVQDKSYPTEDLYAEPCVKCGEVTFAFCEACDTKPSSPPYAICTNCDADQMVCHQCDESGMTWDQARQTHRHAFQELLKEHDQGLPQPHNDQAGGQEKPIEYDTNRTNGVFLNNGSAVQELIRRMQPGTWLGHLLPLDEVSQQRDDAASVTQNQPANSSETYNHVYCQPCEIWLQDPDQWINHCKGRMHLKNLKKRRQQPAGN